MKTEKQREQYRQELNVGLSTFTARRSELAAAAHYVLHDSIKAAEVELQKQLEAEGVAEYGVVELNDYYIENMDSDAIDFRMRPVVKHYGMSDIEVDVAVMDAIEIAYKFLTLNTHTPCAGNA